MLLFVLLAFPITALYAQNHMRNISHSTSQSPEPQGQRQQGVYSKKQMMIIKACLLLFTTFYICWLPFLVILGILLYCDQLYQDSPMIMAQYFTMALIPINSLAKPVIYGYRLPDLKSELYTMLLNWSFRCRENN